MRSGVHRWNSFTHFHCNLLSATSSPRPLFSESRTLAPFSPLSSLSRKLQWHRFDDPVRRWFLAPSFSSWTRVSNPSLRTLFRSSLLIYYTPSSDYSNLRHKRFPSPTVRLSHTITLSNEAIKFRNRKLVATISSHPRYRESKPT